jgi:hypothetical protein
MSRLIDLVGLSKDNLFQDRADLIAEACQLREKKISYTKA